MNNIEIKCKEDNVKMILRNTHDGHIILTCPYCDKQIKNYGPLTIKL